MTSTLTPSGPGAPPPRTGRRRASTLTVLGLVLLLAGLGCLGWVGYQLFGTDVVASRTFDRQASGLRSSWGPGTTDAQDTGSSASTPTGRDQPAVPGTAIALLRVPRFGAGYEVPVVAGTAASDLARGVGHYDGTASPGEVGNFAVAGHRITHGQPFARLLTLEAGDQIVVETRQAVFTYVVDRPPRDLTLPDTAGWVLDPVPGEHVPPTRALITLTTCQDLFHSPDRSVGFGHLARTQVK